MSLDQPAYDEPSFKALCLSMAKMLANAHDGTPGMFEAASSISDALVKYVLTEHAPTVSPPKKK
jgi:hypothetical protein